MKASRSKAVELPEKSPLPAGINVAIDPAQLRDHEMQPPHLLGTLSDRGPEDEPGLLPFKRRSSRARARALKHLDAQAFANALHKALKDQVVGYAMRLKKDGATAHTQQCKWAQTPADCSLSWGPDRQMHVASVSKLITAMAMIKLLDDKGISHDAKIVDYLPVYWPKGPNVHKIKFRHLLSHTSGFATANNAMDFLTMKMLVAQGVATAPPALYYLGKSRYENANFALCRILIAILNGGVAKGSLMADNAWDLATITSYLLSVATNVLAPSGVTNATLHHASGGALAYDFSADCDGWNSGNLMTASGGAGWHMSVNELLKVMGTFRREGKIVSKERAQWMLDKGFGIDVIEDTPAGTLYNKNGLWRCGDQKKAHVEQCLAYFLPENMELALFVNSYVGTQPKSLRDLVTGLYLNHLN